MTDMFLDALTPSLTDGGRGCYSQFPAHNFDRHGNRRPPPPVAPSKPVQAPPIAPNPGARPDYADEIDTMVRALETAGYMVFDGEAQAYRRPHYRRYRFTMGE